MSRTIMLIPTDAQVDLMQVSLEVTKAMQKAGINFCSFSPIAQSSKTDVSFPTISSLTAEHIESLLIANKQDVLMEEFVAKVIENRKDANVVLVEGVPVSYSYANYLNAEIAKALGAEIVFVMAVENDSLTRLNKSIDLATLNFGGSHNKHIKGVFLSNVSTVLAADLKNNKCALPVLATDITNGVSKDWLETLKIKTDSTLLSPPAFRYQLTELARKAGKRVVLPEGDEPRTVKAAVICAERGIAECVLLGNPEAIKKVAKSQGVKLGKGIKVIDPELVREDYVTRLVELRKSKGMTEELARQQLTDNVVLGTLMLERDEVDGLVSGAVHTTANTIRPPLQLIKTAPGSSLVSSVFFMLLPEQVFIYGDCAINPNPNAAELSDIAIQSADTAKAFGIEPRVAMLSYSTINSGVGPDVDLVREATNLVKEKRPDILVDGPLQYDAAAMPDVASAKAPDSPVAGKANVFIFPNLSAGNIGYKAVQRAAELVSIGPMLQGMRKPVNDLSRGALVDDIVYTIALTAIQATQTA